MSFRLALQRRHKPALATEALMQARLKLVLVNSFLYKVLSLERNAHRQQQSSWRLRKEKRGHEYRILVHRRTRL